MPRYYFHFSDGTRLFSDSSGHELSGLREARSHALKDVRALSGVLCEWRVQDLSDWTMTVVDEAGKAVFALGFDLRPRLVDRAPHRSRRGGAL